MDKKDFEEIEKATLERITTSQDKDASGLTKTIAAIAARAATVALHEYHKRLEKEK